ncbi:hypothetical protein [Kingella sp. (in: b-proteobacteria)]|uniref:hypothetical protein n=1 Tax=Kingella sp. (in: b-proteobacteria) TaxID=2020713 RepID=UPI0026DBD7D6|nr:hypothetical protein [Kingella sp. (in: b-proteobacteria)]MDO4658715.1 hypothetical protein [Kingella sp. (in: b-proteobacteria)]
MTAFLIFQAAAGSFATVSGCLFYLCAKDIGASSATIPRRSGRMLNNALRTCIHYLHRQI